MTNASARERYWAARKFYESLLISERISPERLEKYQETQLQQLLAHAAEHVPFYREPLSSIRNSDGRFDLDRWTELPIVSRDIVTAQWDEFQPSHLPEGHRAVLESTTSGSEGGSPLRMRKTRFEHTGVACASYRYADWFKYDYGTALAMIRAGFIRPANKDDPEDKLWGPPWIPQNRRGARYRLDINVPVDEQMQWLRQLGTVYLNTLPSNAMALAQFALAANEKPCLAGILTVGERLSADVRHEVQSIFGCQISDVYATAECGLIAIECPDTGNYHIQSEISKVEVLKADGTQCTSGETGQVVATSLYNYAMPIIRYRFNDLVTLGDGCSCRRTLPVLSQIVGREKGLFKFDSGKVALPDYRTEKFRELAGTPYWQVAQTSPTKVELRLKGCISMTDRLEKALTEYICSILPAKVEVEIKRVTGFTRSRGGKFYPVIREFR
jgi:phenylacetate-CoA ligase